MPVVLDRPPTDDAVDMPPETAPQLRRQWWRYMFPWVKTAVGAPTEDDDLLIVNATDEAWILWLGYRSLGMVPPRLEWTITVARPGLLSARRVGAPVGTEYLTLSLTRAVHAVQIAPTVLPDETPYILRVIERPRARRTRRAVTR